MRNAIVVLGMHRSGTSMVSGILELAGFDLGKHQWQADHANAKGYFENSQVGIFNDQLFSQMHRTWYDTLLLPDNWWLFPEILRKVDRLAEIIRDEFESTSFLLFKDPRISILLPFYLMAFEKLRIRPYFIINFRKPSEVAASLKKRNNLSISKSLILWMDYTLQAELFTRNHNRIFIQYDQVLANPIAFLKHLFNHFKLEHQPPSSQVQRITEFVEKELNHQSGQNVADQTIIPESVKNMYDLICTLHAKEAKESALFNQLDTLSSQFYSEYRFFQGIDKSHEAMLQIETEFKKRKTFSLPFHLGTNLLIFQIEDESIVERLVLNPCNQRAGLVISKTLVTNKKNEKFEIKPNYTNAEWDNEQQALVFESETPELTYILNPPMALKNISFELEYIVTENPTYRYGAQLRNQKIDQISSEKNELIDQRNIDLSKLAGLNDQLMGSLTEIGHLKNEYSKKESDYQHIVSLGRKEIEMLQQAIDWKQQELAVVLSNLATLEAAKKEIIEAHRNEINCMTDKMNNVEALSNSLIESKQSEIHHLHGEIIRLKEESQQIQENKARQEKEFEETIRIIKDDLSEFRKIYEQKISQYQSVVAEKERQISVIFNSYTWKTGKIILSPLQLLMKKK